MLKNVPSTVARALPSAAAMLLRVAHQRATLPKLEQQEQLTPDKAIFILQADLLRLADHEVASRRAVHQKLGHLHLERGDRQKAIQHLTHAVQRNSIGEIATDKASLGLSSEDAAGYFAYLSLVRALGRAYYESWEKGGRRDNTLFLEGLICLQKVTARLHCLAPTARTTETMGANGPSQTLVALLQGTSPMGHSFLGPVQDVNIIVSPTLKMQRDGPCAKRRKTNVPDSMCLYEAVCKHPMANGRRM